MSQSSNKRDLNGSADEFGKNGNTSQVLGSIDGRKRFKFRNALERRAMKQRLHDRRTEARYDESGTQQPDRRLANRLANDQKRRKTGQL